MKVRSTVATVAALASTYFGAQPAQAVTAADVHMQIDVSCFGCGSSNGRVAWWCYGPCVVNGNVCLVECHYYGWGSVNSPAATCPATLTAAGTIAFPNGVQSFTLNAVPGGWTATFSGGSVAAGTWAVTAPVGIPCGAPASVTFLGAQTGP
ncbi:MAG TPA: hypothetical protein VFQ85_19425 [Mycobacteriales bacterium]|jgi:hypothetical protein|nr:hypothetical protein [Mycobacteriales bacterium]